MSHIPNKQNDATLHYQSKLKSLVIPSWYASVVSTILVSDLFPLKSFTFRSINQKYQKYLLYCLSISIRSHFCEWYVFVVSIIFDCSMPIFYNFHILLATFYIIFGTNILIQCLVPVPVCCMFFVSQKTHIKRSPNGIKTSGEYFWNICDIWEEESTRDGARGGHKVGARTWPSWAPRKAVAALLWPQES